MRTASRWLSLGLVFMIPWENAVTIGALGTLTRVVGLAVAAFWVFTILIEGRFRKLQGFHLVAYLFVLWNIVTVLWSFDLERTTYRIQTYLQLIGLVLILWDLCTTPAMLEAALQAYILGAYVSIGSTVFNYSSAVEAYAYSGGRYSGAGLNAGDLALILSLGLPVAWHLAVSSGQPGKRRLLKLVNYAYIPAALFTILLTASRMALFAVLPTVVFTVGTISRLKPSLRLFLIVALLGALFAIQTFVPQSILGRLATTGSSIAEGDLGGRVGLWGATWTAFAEHPLLGVGADALRAVIDAHSVAHNTPLSVLAESGLIGFGLFVILLAIVVRKAIYQEKWYSRLWLTVLAVWAIGTFAQTWESRKPTWLFLGLIVVSASLYGQHDESRATFDHRERGVPAVHLAAFPEASE